MNLKPALMIPLALTLFITSPITLACKGTDVLFQENFSKLDPAWGSTNAEKTLGQNKLTLQPNLGMEYVVLNQAHIFQDMDFCADVVFKKGDNTNAGGGLAFWGKDFNDYYFFFVLGDGSYYVGRYFNGRYLYPVPGDKTPAVDTKEGAVNHLRVVTKGNEATFYINDKEVASFSGQPPEGGGLIGVVADSGAKEKNTWEFSNIKVTKP